MRRETILAKGVVRPLRLALFGFGTVGQWLAEALHTQRAWLQQEFGLAVSIIAVATAHHGLISGAKGWISPPYSIWSPHDNLSLPIHGHPLDEYLGRIARDFWDVLAEATGATLRNGEPGLRIFVLRFSRYARRYLQ